MRQAAKFFIFLFAMVLCSRAWAGTDDTPAGYRVVYQTNFSQGLDGRLAPQGPTDSLTVVPAPWNASESALRAHITKTDDFSRVANGVPRAEISFANAVRFEEGKDYWVRWSIYIPEDYVFDAKQPEGISQIHGGPNRGSPPFGLSLSGGQYEVGVRNGENVRNRQAGAAARDKGRFVRWKLHYVPDASGSRSVTALWKDEELIFNDEGTPNAHPNDSRAYFKMGIYKWWWVERASDVNERTLYFGDVIISVKE